MINMENIDDFNKQYESLKDKRYLLKFDGNTISLVEKPNWFFWLFECAFTDVEEKYLISSKSGLVNKLITMRESIVKQNKPGKKIKLFDENINSVLKTIEKLKVDAINKKIASAKEAIDKTKTKVSNERKEKAKSSIIKMNEQIKDIHVLFEKIRFPVFVEEEIKTGTQIPLQPLVELPNDFGTDQVLEPDLSVHIHDVDAEQTAESVPSIHDKELESYQNEINTLNSYKYTKTGLLAEKITEFESKINNFNKNLEEEVNYYRKTIDRKSLLETCENVKCELKKLDAEINSATLGIINMTAKIHLKIAINRHLFIDEFFDFEKCISNDLETTLNKLKNKMIEVENKINEFNKIKKDILLVVNSDKRLTAEDKEHFTKILSNCLSFEHIQECKDQYEKHVNQII